MTQLTLIIYIVNRHKSLQCVFTETKRVIIINDYTSMLCNYNDSLSFKSYFFKNVFQFNYDNYVLVGLEIGC